MAQTAKLINQALQDVLIKFIELGSNINISLTIGNVYHIIKLNKTCICNICNDSKSIDLTDIDRYCMLEIIISCNNFECNDPIEFIIWELQSSDLNKLSTFNQFINRNSMISKRMNTKIINNIQSNIPSILRTDIILHCIFEYVGGDYFITLWKQTRNMSKNIEMETSIEPLLLCSNDEQQENDNNNIYSIALIDYFGNIICRISPYFRSPDWSSIYIDDDNINPSIFTYIGDKMLRWELRENDKDKNDNLNLLKLDITFHHQSQFDNICSSRYWNYSGLSRGIFVWNANIYIASEEHHHVLNNIDNDKSSKYCSKISISKISTLSGCVINKYEIDIDETVISSNYDEQYDDDDEYDEFEDISEIDTDDEISENRINSSLLNNCDFMVTSCKWLLLENDDRLQCSYCFVLIHRSDKIINFIDPISCTIKRKIKINKTDHSFSGEMRIIFIDNDDDQQIIGYSIPNEDSHPFGFRECDLNVIIIDINGNILKSINLPLGDWIQYVSISNKFIYIDVMAGQFGKKNDKNNNNDDDDDNNNTSSQFEEIVSDEESDDIINNKQNILNDNEWINKLEKDNNNKSKLKWFSSSSWRYILDINNLDIFALYSIKHGDKYCKLFKHVNPTIFNF